MAHASHTFISISAPRYVLDLLNELRKKREFCREPQYLTLYKVLKFYKENHASNDDTLIKNKDA